MTEFRLVDLVSRRDAVRAYLRGKSADEMLQWLSERGQIVRQRVGERDFFHFESAEGVQAIFFFDDGEIVFVGDHTTFV